MPYFGLRRDHTAEDVGPWLATIQAAAAVAREVYVFFKHEPEAPGRALVIMGALATDPTIRSCRNGVVGLLTLGLYGVARFVLSYFQADSLWLFNLRQTQVAFTGQRRLHQARRSD